MSEGFALFTKFQKSPNDPQVIAEVQAFLKKTNAEHPQLIPDLIGSFLNKNQKPNPQAPTTPADVPPPTAGTPSPSPAPPVESNYTFTAYVQCEGLSADQFMCHRDFDNTKGLMDFL